MHLITKKEFIKKLKTVLKQKIKIKITGYINLEIRFQEFNFCIIDDELNLQDEISKDNITFNLNNVSNIQEENGKIICYLNDKIDTAIEINI